MDPLVFSQTIKLIIHSGSLNSINEELFKVLKNIISIDLNPTILRKINHKQGLKWIRNINSDVNVDFDRFNISKLKNVRHKLFLITNEKKLSKKNIKTISRRRFLFIR